MLDLEGQIEEAGVVEAPVSRSGSWEPDGARHKTIAVLGSHPATVMQTPFSDPSVYVYACSPHNVEHRTLPRVDCFCELHDPIEDPTRAFGYLKAVSAMPVVMMRDKRALASGNFPGARPYPEDKLKGTSVQQRIKLPLPDGKVEVRQVEVPKHDGIFDPTKFTSSIAYMLAKAILDCCQGEEWRLHMPTCASVRAMHDSPECPASVRVVFEAAEAAYDKFGWSPPIDQIGIWGVMQASETEYTYQRPGIQYFLRRAMDMGIRVQANRESCLFDMPQWKW